MNQTPIQPDSPLFQAVQLMSIFRDSKTFADCLPKKEPAELEREFKALLAQFVADSFELPEVAGQTDEILPAANMVQHIDRLWGLLKREPNEQVPPTSNLIGLPYPYIVPGGRFREIYYWDSYFTAEGLVLSDEADLLEMMIKNFAYLIEQYGHIPNGNRTYFLSRSQPPFFCFLLQLLERQKGTQAVVPYLAALQNEYAYWMDGEEWESGRVGEGESGRAGEWESGRVGEGKSSRIFSPSPIIGTPKGEHRLSVAPKACKARQSLCRPTESRGGRGMRASFDQEADFPRADKKVVKIAPNVILNRYYDAKNKPRPESFKEDVALFWQAADSRRAEIYRNLRSAAESGWDFSYRWFGEDGQMSSIRTTEIIPVDLNCLLFNIETQLARWLAPSKPSLAQRYAQAAAQRQAAIIQYCWNEEEGWFFDYCWTENKQTSCWSLAGAYPLFCQVATPAQAAKAAQQIEKRFLKPGGVVSTLTETGEQWDGPNGWAPLQWVTVQGLLNYQHDQLAKEIAQRFVSLADKVYQRTGKMMEKYNVCDLSLEAGGGEYALQDGFGWTNGVVKAFLMLLRNGEAV